MRNVRLAVRLVRKGFRDGLTAPDLQRAVLEAYLALALERCRRGNGRVNASRVELLTGLPRRGLTSNSVASDVWARATVIPWVRRLEQAWRIEPRYLDAHGHPVPLPVDVAAPSFEALWKKHGGTHPKRALLDALLDLRLVENESGLLRLTRRSR